MNLQRVRARDGRPFQFLCLAFVINVAIVLDAAVVMAGFDPMSFIESNTTTEGWQLSNRNVRMDYLRVA